MQAGQRADGDRREGRAIRCRAGLRDGLGGELGHQRQPAEVRGLALVGGHAERGVALEVLDRAETLVPGERHVLVRDIVLKIDERLAARAAHAPKRRQGHAFRIDLRQLDRLAAEAAVGGRLEPAPGTRLQRIGKAEPAAGRAGDAHALRQGPGYERRDRLVPYRTPAEVRGQMHGRAPAAGDTNEIAGDAHRIAGCSPDIDGAHAQRANGPRDGAAGDQPRTGGLGRGLDAAGNASPADRRRPRRARRPDARSATVRAVSSLVPNTTARRPGATA